MSLENNEMETFIKNNLIRTDGYIINKFCNKKIHYKLKPANDMTIDLLFNGEWVDRDRNKYNVFPLEKSQRGVYRCVYDNHRFWKAQDYRPEKLKLNPKSICDLITEFHRKPWTYLKLKIPKELLPKF